MLLSKLYTSSKLTINKNIFETKVGFLHFFYLAFLILSEFIYIFCVASQGCRIMCRYPVLEISSFRFLTKLTL